MPERVADRYALAERLGAGGMGAVYRARDELLDRDVAVKVIVDDGARGLDFARACVHEARSAASVRHPGIVQVYDGGVDDGIGYVVMEYVRGETLRAALDARAPLPPDEATAIAAHLADALAAAHAAGVVHCDVKPANVILLPDGMPTLVDFGIARSAAATHPLDADGPRGSVHYVAPEQLSGGAVDGRSDVYALGVLTYEMLTGHPPFEGSNGAAIAAQRLVSVPRPPRELNPAVSTVLEQVVLVALARDPTDRYDAAGFRDALRAAGAGDDATAPLGTIRLARLPSVLPATPSPTAPVWLPPAPRSRPRWALAAGGIAIALLIVWTVAARAGWSTPAGGATVTVPNLIGRPLADVPSVLKQAGLVARDASARGADAGRAGTVLEQDPAAGATVRAGDGVRIVVGVLR